MNRATITGGYSSKNSVSFFLKGAENGIEAIREEDGTITTREISLGSSKEFIIFIMICGGFRECIFHLNGARWLYYVPTAVWILLFIVAIVQQLVECEMRKYHGAEHKVANWYKKKKRGEGINIAGIERCSRIHRCCGTNIVSTIVTLQLVSAICMYDFNFHIPEYMTIVVAFCIYDIFPFNFLGVLMQLITTQEPNRKHIYVAVTALTALLEKSE